MRYQNTIEKTSPTELSTFIEDKKNISQNIFWVVLAYVACGIIWGTTWFAVRVCVLPSGYPPFLAAAARFTMAALTLGLIWVLRPFPIGTISKRNFVWTMIACLISASGFALVYVAEKWISGGLAAIINATAPLVMAAVAKASSLEKVNKTSILGSIIAFVGIFVIFQESFHTSSSQALAVLLLIAAVILGQVNNAVLKHHTQGLNHFTASSLLSIALALIFWVATIVWEKQLPALSFTSAPFMAAAYLGIFGTALSFICYFYLLKHVRLMTMSTLVLYPPLIALIVDALWEKSFVPSLTTYIGITIALIGVAVNLLVPRFSVSKL